MPIERFSNAIATQLNGAINGSVTTVVVDDASTFPLTYFRVIVESEIMYCTSRSSNTLTVIRGYEGTSAASHADNIAINHILTAGSLNQFRLNLLAAANMVPDAVSLSADDDEFDDESFSGWTKVWHGTSPVLTETEKFHQLSIQTSGSSAAARYAAYLKAKTPSPGDWVQMGFTVMGLDEGYPLVGLIYTDGVTFGSGNQVIVEASAIERAIALRTETGFNTNTGQSNKNAYGDFHGNTMHMRLIWRGPSGGNNTWELLYSTDGISWGSTGVFNLGTNFVSTPPAYMGFSFSIWTASQNKCCTIRYVRFSF